MQSSRAIICIIFTIMHIIFLPDQDFSCCKDVLSTADLCTLILCVTTSLVNIREVAIVVWSAQTVQVLCYYFALYHYYCNYIFNYLHYSKTQSRNWGWNSMQITGQLHHPSGGKFRTLLEASSSGVDSFLDRKDAFSHNRAGIDRSILRVGTTDVWKPACTHGRTKLIAQVINGLGNQCPLVLPHVIRQSKILTNLKIMRIISIIRIIDVICTSIYHV